MRLGILLTLLLSLPAAAAPPPYAWVDATCAVHQSADLQQVAEPFRSAYRAQLAAAARGAKPDPEAMPATPAAASQLHARRALRAALAQQRQLLLRATAQLLAQRQAPPAEPNPLLAQLPAGRQANAAAAARIQLICAELQASRQALLVDLPAQARKDHLPPAWLD